MPFYKYKVSDENGKIIEILIEGDSHQDSLSRLRQRGLVPLEFFGEKSLDDNESFVPLGIQRKFDVCEFTNLLVPLIASHIPLEKALMIISQASPNEFFYQTVNRLRKGLHEGKKFSYLIKENGNLFPRIYSNLIEAGEETGSLIEVATVLRKYLNDRKEIREFLITSSIYPAFVILVVSLVVTLMFTVFIPKFAKIFTEMGKPMPSLTNCVFITSKILTEFWWLWMALFILFLIIIFTLKKMGILKKLWDEYSLKIPVLGNIIIINEISRFIKTLSVLVKSHVNVLNSVNISINVLSNAVISKTFSFVTTDLKGGKKLSAALSRSAYMPKTALQMLAVGEETGTVAEMLEQVSNNLEEQLRNRIKRLLALFEPVVILILAGIIIIVVLSIILAILELQNI